MYLILHLRKCFHIDSQYLFLLPKHSFLHAIKLVRQLLHCSRVLIIFFFSKPLYENLFWQLHVWSITFANCSQVARQVFSLPPLILKWRLLILHNFRFIKAFWWLSTIFLYHGILKMKKKKSFRLDCLLPWSFICTSV